MKNGMKELLKGNLNSRGGSISSRTIGIDAVSTGTMVYGGANNAEETFSTATEDENSGELTTAQLESDDLTDISPLVGDKNDIISLSLGSWDSTVTSLSPPPANAMPASLVFPDPIDEDPEITSISHAGTHKHLRTSKTQTVTHPFPKRFTLVEHGETTLVTKHQPGHICGTPHKLPGGMSIKGKICFFWYHQGYCHAKKGSKCPCVHTLDTSAREVSFPNELRFHNPDCQLPLCPARLRNRSEQKSVIQQKLFAQKKRAQAHPEWIRSPPTGPRLKEKTTHISRSFALHEKICFSWYHQGYCRPRKDTSCPCLHTLDTGVKEVALPNKLRYHNLDCELSLCPVRLRYESGQEIVFAQSEEEGSAKDMHWSLIPAAIHPSRVQNVTPPEQPCMETDRIALKRLRKQFRDRMNQLIHKYGSWQASPPNCVQPMEQLETAIGLWDLLIRANSDSVANLPIGFRQRAIALGNAIEEQKLQTRLQNKSESHPQYKPALTHTPIALKVMAPNVVTDMSIVSPPKGPRTTSVKPPELPKSIAPTHIFGKAGNSNIIPVSRKRKALGSEYQLPTHQVKRTRPTLFNTPHGGDYPDTLVDTSFKNPVFFSDFLAKNVVQTKPQFEAKKAQPGVLVDYVLPSGKDRAEWDTDFLRRVFGEIE